MSLMSLKGQERHERHNVISYVPDVLRTQEQYGDFLRVKGVKSNGI